MDKVLYSELNPSEFRKRLSEAPIAYLPLGTLEWHGEHLPLGSDSIQSQGFFELLAKEIGGIVLPPLFLGPDNKTEIAGKELYGMDYFEIDPDRENKQPHLKEQLDGSAYWVPDETFTLLLDATLKQLKRAGFKIVVAHGHGPSTHHFIKTIPQWKEKYDLECFACWGSEQDEEGLGLMVDHAAMNETSILMALRPDLVQLEKLPQDLHEWPLGIAGQDPRTNASKALGEKIISLQLKRMIHILKERLK
ncbi:MULTISPECIES: creatininase family protein [Bacillaceae]|uniref:Creatininase family protein n=1 Tax=Evansella alkalicola TaxID=745819 RepID=A0ABS6JX88_9BACI|nr:MULTISPECIES: creatininase family protein [Bacillaceae]MBU9723204.1 creatininase family protein [Bacillus alkalicola]